MRKYGVFGQDLRDFGDFFCPDATWKIWVRLIFATGLFFVANVSTGSENTSFGECVAGICFPRKGTNESNVSNTEIPEGVVRVVNVHSSGNRGLSTVEQGSGSVINAGDGRKLVLSANHIFREGTGTVSISFRNGKRVECELIGKDEKWDVAVIRPKESINASGIKLASKTPMQNDSVFACGYGPDGTLKAFSGKLLGYSRIEGGSGYETMKLGTAVRNGDSGGPVLNEQLELIGVLWGCDGDSSYATYIGRIEKIIAPFLTKTEENIKTEIVQENDSVTKMAPGKTDVAEKEKEKGVSFDAIDSPLAYVGEKAISKALLALGFSTPPSIAVYYLLKTSLKLYRRRKNAVRKSSVVEKSDACEEVPIPKPVSVQNLEDEYAEQLNSLYEMSGRTTTADATLGRLYERKLQEAEESSNPEIAKYAQTLRKQVSEQFLRIHSSSPLASEW